jgi:NADH-quinone oxidoreductase subunit L
MTAVLQALLFLVPAGDHRPSSRAGSAQDGGLRHYMPVTYATMWVGALALAGIRRCRILFQDAIIDAVQLSSVRRSWLAHHGGGDRVLHLPHVVFAFTARSASVVRAHIDDDHAKRAHEIPRHEEHGHGATPHESRG